MTFIGSAKSSENEIILCKYDPPAAELLLTDQQSISVAFVDAETTGVDRANDKIIELALKVVVFERSSGKIISIKADYQSFNDPKQNISEEITLLTGINDAMVKGEFVDWKEVDSILQTVDLIVAHNASFDRAFLDRYSSESPKKIWACSIADIDWLNKGFSSPMLELLCYWHGFYFDAHRAMGDVDALIHLLTHRSYQEERPLVELIENSSRSVYIIVATNFRYDPVKKDIVKGNKYKWDPKDKLWSKTVSFEDLEKEKDWLTSAIYDSHFEGKVKQIDLSDKYK